MNPSKVVKDLMSLKETYRKQNFSYTAEQQAQYKELLELRRARVQQFYKDCRVWVGPSHNKSTNN